MSHEFRHCIEEHLVRDETGRNAMELPADWAGLPMALSVIPGNEELRDVWNGVPTLLVARSGSGRRWYRSGHVTRELSTRPAMIEFYAADFQLDHAVWCGEAGQCVGVQFPTAALRELMQEDPPRAEIPTLHELRDARIVSLVEALANEIGNRGASGRLYAQGLSLALVSLLQSLRPIAPAPARRRTLAAPLAARVEDYIDAHIDRELSVGELAALVGLSSTHFARMFAATFGTTPHRYVLDRRVKRAAQMLRHADMPISHVAYSLGFSSQAHFTSVFRRHTGRTPGRARSS